MNSDLLNNSVIRQNILLPLLLLPPPVQKNNSTSVALGSGLRFDSQTQSELVPLDLSILVGVAVTQQDGSQLVQIGTRHVGLQRMEKEGGVKVHVSANSTHAPEPLINMQGGEV